MKNFALTSCVVLLAFAASQSYAQDNETIIAERPGFSSSPVTLAPGMLQVETGYQYTHEGGSLDLDDHTLPLALFRVGLTDRLELQLSWAGLSWVEVANSNAHGSNDAGIGVKWQVSDPGAAVPLALFAGVSLPTGDRAFTSDEVEPTLGAFWSYSAGLDWFGTVLVSDSFDDTTVGNAIGVGLPINADTGAYIEYFGRYAGRGGPENYLNGGIAYLPRNDMQLDLHAGLGLNDRAADLFIGFGFAYRF